MQIEITTFTLMIIYLMIMIKYNLYLNYNVYKSGRLSITVIFIYYTVTHNSFVHV